MPSGAVTVAAQVCDGGFATGYGSTPASSSRSSFAIRTRTCSGRRGPVRDSGAGRAAGALPSSRRVPVSTSAGGADVWVPVWRRALRSRPKLGSVRKPSAIADAIPTRGSTRLSAKHRNRGTHSGWYFTLDRYSASSCHQREKNTSTERHSRSTGPAPIRAPSSNTERNTAKFNEIRVIPNSPP